MSPRSAWDAMRTADRRRHLVLEGAALERFQQLLNIADQISAARINWTLRHVSRTSEEVMP